jgi:hypothetical protein
VETRVDGFIVDVVRPRGLVEIQTTSFASARRKLERLVETHDVLLVYPIPLEKWLVVVDAAGAIIRRRRSPRRGAPIDAFDELVYITALLAHPRFRVELALTREEEVRGPVPREARYRHPPDWWRLDRRLIEVLATLSIERPRDLLQLLPEGLAPQFTTRDIAIASGRSHRLAMRAAYCLERSGAVVKQGRRGRFVVFGVAT